MKDAGAKEIQGVTLAFREFEGSVDDLRASKDRIITDFIEGRSGDAD